MRVFFYFALVMLCACKSEKFASVKDNEMGVQALSVASDATALVYKVRVFPAEKWISNNREQLVKKMNFETDSIFSILSNGIDYYPESVTPVANGIGTSFEYLVEFSRVESADKSAIELVYHDKYMSKKNYKLLLK